MSRKFIFLVNPISGNKSKKSLSALIGAAAAKYKAPFEILPTVASGNYDFVRQQIKEQRFTDVIMCGGDGTVNTVVQQLYDTDVNFGIVPLGSGNGLALSARIPIASPKALDVVFTGVPTYIDAFTINKSFACMLCGLGLDAQVAHDFAKQSKRGLITYTRQTIRNFFTAKPYSFEIHVGETSFTTEAYFISIANSNQFGNRVTIAPKASLSDGLLDLVVVRKMNKAQLPVSVLLQVAGNNSLTSPASLKKSGIIYLQADSLVIKNHDAAPLHVDGEPRETSKQFNIRVIPQCFKLIQPS